jgi:hypothetical protein
VANVCFIKTKASVEMNYPLIQNFSRRVYLVIFTIFSFASLSGCGTTRSTDVSPEIQEAAKVTMRDQIQSGQLRLTCQFSCAGIWGYNRKRIKNLLTNESWDDAALEVAKIGEEDDLGYFYLGQAMEHLDNIKAAKIYYGLALRIKWGKCAKFINNCDGTDVPQQARAGLDRLEKRAIKPNDEEITTAKASNAPQPSPTPLKTAEPLPNLPNANAPKPQLDLPVAPTAISTPIYDPVKSGEVHVVQSEFDSGVSLVGKTESLQNPEFAHSRDWYLLSSFERVNPKISLFALRVSDTYVSPRRKEWQSATTDRAQTLELRQSDSKYLGRFSGGIRVEEQFVIFLPLAVVEEGTKRDIRIQVRGEGGESMVLTVPSLDMTAILQAQRNASAQKW